MPALGESVTEGTVTRWLKQPGDHVEAGEALLEVSTDKVDTEIEAPASGILSSILVPEDSTVPVGAEIAMIGGSMENETPSAASQTHKQPAEVPRVQAEQTYDEAAALAAPRPVYVTPAVRALVRQHGIDLATIVGTGANARVTKRDVERYLAEQSSRKFAQEDAVATAPISPIIAPPQTSAAAGTHTQKLSRLRATIASRMVESLQVSAQLTTVVEVDITRVARLRSRHNASVGDTGPRLSFLPFVAKATCEALAAHPVLNARIDTQAGEVTFRDAIDLGIAVDTERGLLVPVIPAAGDLNVVGLARHISDVAERTRDSRISPDELSGGSFTITNTGSRGALFDTPILNQPQVGILGVGAVVKRPVVTTTEEGQDVISIRSMLYLALTYDHRLVDGADAARFLGTLKTRVEGGEFDHDLAG